MKKKVDKTEAIVNVLDALDKVTRKLQKCADQYDRYMLEAAMMQDDVHAKQFIREKISINKWISALKRLGIAIRAQAAKALAINGLADLPSAINACLGILSESPNFDKLEKSIRKIAEELNKSGEGLQKIDEALNPTPQKRMSSILEDSNEEEETEEFKAEYAALMEKVKSQINAEKVVNANPADSLTGDIDYEGIVKKENETED